MGLLGVSSLNFILTIMIFLNRNDLSSFMAGQPYRPLPKSLIASFFLL